MKQLRERVRLASVDRRLITAKTSICVVGDRPEIGLFHHLGAADYVMMRRKRMDEQGGRSSGRARRSNNNCLSDMAMNEKIYRQEAHNRAVCPHADRYNHQPTPLALHRLRYDDQREWTTGHNGNGHQETPTGTVNDPMKNIYGKTFE